MTPGLLTRFRLLSSVRKDHATISTRSRRRDARWSLTIAAITLLLLSLGLAVSLDTVMPEWRDPEFGHRLTLSRRVNTPDRPLVVVIGTSRTQNGICPSAMGYPSAPTAPRVFNFGQSASPPLKMLLTLRRLIDAGVKPAAVVVELLPASLMSGGPAESQLRDSIRKLSLRDVEHLGSYWGNAQSVRAELLKLRVNPWYGQRQLLMNHWLPRWQPWESRYEFQWTSLDEDGFQPMPEVGGESRQKAIAHARKEYAGAFTGFSPQRESVRAVKELVELCRTEGIATAFLLPPMSPAFRASFAPGVHSMGEAHLLELARRLEVPVFPAPVDMNEDEFLDGHHLYRRGAERYSRWLADNHLKPWLVSVGIGGAP